MGCQLRSFSNIKRLIVRRNNRWKFISKVFTKNLKVLTRNTKQTPQHTAQSVSPYITYTRVIDSGLMAIEIYHLPQVKEISRARSQHAAGCRS
jgi:hypothetical protein